VDSRVRQAQIIIRSCAPMVVAAGTKPPRRTNGSVRVQLVVRRYRGLAVLGVRHDDPAT